MSTPLAPLRPLFVHAGILGLCMNLLMLVPALYMVQVFDRVLTSRSDATLVVLTLGTLAALLVLLWLDLLRGRLLASAGIAFELDAGPKVMARQMSQAASVRRWTPRRWPARPEARWRAPAALCGSWCRSPCWRREHGS